MSEIALTEFDPLAEAEISAQELLGGNLVCSVAGTALGGAGIERLSHGDLIGFTLLVGVGSIIGIAGNVAKNSAVEELEQAYQPPEQKDQ